MYISIFWKQKTIVLRGRPRWRKTSTGEVNTVNSSSLLIIGFFQIVFYNARYSRFEFRNLGKTPNLFIFTKWKADIMPAFRGWRPQGLSPDNWSFKTWLPSLQPVWKRPFRDFKPTRNLNRPSNRSSINFYLYLKFDFNSELFITEKLKNNFFWRVSKIILHCEFP